MIQNNAMPQIMGILNVTPDSFSDGGRHQTAQAALAQACSMLEQGADWIDVGGESTRPGSLPVSADEQIRRVIPVIRAIRAEFPQARISIDTTSSIVARAAWREGANMVNDVSAGEDDADMLPLVAESGLPVVLMHRQGRPQTMQDSPYYDDVVNEVLHALQRRVEAALGCGVAEANIVLDPGIGFGKRREDNLALLAHLPQLLALGFPVLLGASRKRFMGSICQVERPDELVTATAVTTALGVMSGVQMFRVHDVQANRQALQVAWAIKQAV
jgi:dihydropteroate synthase